MGSLNMEKKWVFPLAISSLMCLFLFATFFNMGMISSVKRINSIFSMFPSINHSSQYYVETKIENPQPPPPPPAAPPTPRFAYLISGSKGDLDNLWRTLQALYHPWNYYILHLDLESPVEERLELASRVDKDPIFNKKYKDWDWFINLSASDYPLVTQDDLLHTFSGLQRDLNFIDHTSRLGWKEGGRAMPLIVDPGLYQNTKSEIFWVSPKRPLPTSFRLFTGSAWTVLSRPFVEYVIWGWDNLPRTLLMYYTNFVSSPEGYFQTIVCNAPEFVPTVVNHDMHYIAWDTPPKQHPHTLNINDTAKMIASDAPFARKFNHNDVVLDRIDTELLGRKNGSFTPGGWCAGKPRCSKVGNPSKLKPGPGAQRLTRLLARLVYSAEFRERQCK